MGEVGSEQKKFNKSVVQLSAGDITELDVGAFVFYAQHDLALGSGFGTAISIRGGPTIQKELEGLGPLKTGQAIAGSAGNLKAEYIVHAVGPRFQEQDMEGKLRTTVLSALACADEKGVKRLAVPAMGVGFYGVPLDVSARLTLGTIKEYLQGDTGLEEVVVCVLDSREFKPFQAHFASMS